jgi:hypothetical protein
MFARLSFWLDYTAFPRVADPEAEARKVALVRIATGLILVWRCGLILLDSRHYFETVPLVGAWSLPTLASAAQLALALGLTFGLAPATCATLLMATHAAYSIWTGTYNLGPILLVPTLAALAVLETGRLTLASRLRPTLPATHYRAIYLLLFCVYAGWNFQALLYHLRDTYWISGHTMAVLLTNSYLSRFYTFFRAWESAFPGSYRFMSAVVVASQSLFQLAMIPLMATRWGARFVVVWGWAFILGSLADLQLSVLPLVEVVMWTLVFMPAHCLTRHGAPGTRQEGPERSSAVLFFCAYGVLIVLFFGNAIASFATGRRLPPWFENTVLFYSGLVAPNVFNRVDLSMGDRWAVIERRDGEKWELVPFNGPVGERLAYHRSDLIYFSNSLRWRRGMIDVTDLEAYHRPGGQGYDYARRMVLYDYRRHGGSGISQVTLFRDYASDYSLGSRAERYQPARVLEFTLQVGSQSP